MWVYIILFSTLIILTVISIRPGQHKTIYYCTTAILLFFAAFRGNGFDWLSYKEIYNSLQDGYVREGSTFVEYGFEIICLVSPTYTFLISLVALTSLSITFKGTYYFSKSYYPILGLLIFSTTLFLPTYMGQIRQGIAIAFVTLAVYQNYKNNTKKTIFWIVVASFFHFSALLALILLCVPKRNYSIKTYLLIILVSLLFYRFTMSLMSKILAFNQLGIVQKLLVYATIENEELGVSSTILIRITTFIIVVYINNNKIKEISYLSKVYFCGILVYLLFGFLPQLGGRGSLYFSIYEMVLVPYILYSMRRRYALFLITFFTILLLSIYRIYGFFSSNLNYTSYIPYINY